MFKGVTVLLHVILVLLFCRNSGWQSSEVAPGVAARES